MIVFLPWFGHFGDLVRDVLPWVWSHYQPGDVIGGNPLHAPLYPASPDPQLWALVAAHYPAGYDYRFRPEALEAELRRMAQQRWPRAEIRTWEPYGELYPKPPITLPEPYPVDVVLAPRVKPYHDAKNGWPWEDLAVQCQAHGWSVGLAGARSESLEVPADVVAWDLDPLGDAITGTLRLLHGARVVVSLDSGIGHLASLVDAPQLVIYPHRGDERRPLVLRDGHPVTMRFADMHRWNQRLCLPAWGGPKEVLAAIAEVLTRVRVVKGAIDLWKSRSVSTFPGWSSPEVLLLREPERSLLLRETGNDLIETAPLPARPVPPTSAEIDRRQAACRACTSYQPGSDRCALCGCGFVIAERTRSAVAHCPGGRW
jgi:Glycosyltransferase family 9 (heptosyltransferase)